MNLKRCQLCKLPWKRCKGHGRGTKEFEEILEVALKEPGMTQQEFDRRDAKGEFDR